MEMQRHNIVKKMTDAEIQDLLDRGAEKLLILTSLMINKKYKSIYVIPGIKLNFSLCLGKYMEEKFKFIIQ